MAMALGLALIVVPVSELIFWPVAVETLPGLLVFYGLAALLPFALIERSGARGWRAVVLAGGIFGWVIEGVIVNQTYEAVPFSLIWTPLAWHMVLSVLGAFVGLRWALRRGPVVAVVGCGVTGAFAGLWGAYGWTELAVDAPSGLPFATQIVIATLGLILGHAVLDRVATMNDPSPVPRAIIWGLAGLAALVWGAVWAVPLAPVSLAVPALIALSAWGLHRIGTGAAPVPIAPVPVWRYGAGLAIPLLAIPVQAFAKELVWVSDINVIVALPLVGVGGVLWSSAMLTSLWRGRPG